LSGGGRRFKQCWRCQAPRIESKHLRGLPDVSCLRDDASLLKVDRFAFTAGSFCNVSRRWKMPSYDTVSGVMEFLGSYRKAFENYDTDAILDHFIFPCTIISDAEKIAPSLLQTKEELRAGVDYVQSLHRQIGYSTGELLLLDITELSPRLTGMMIRSRMRDVSGRPLYEFQGFYSLARTDAGCRIMAISHNQIPRLLACASQPSIPIS
jgi:hypothetical protein